VRIAETRAEVVLIIVLDVSGGFCVIEVEDVGWHGSIAVALNWPVRLL